MSEEKETVDKLLSKQDIAEAIDSVVKMENVRYVFIFAITEDGGWRICNAGRVGLLELRGAKETAYDHFDMQIDDLIDKQCEKCEQCEQCHEEEEES